MANPPVCRIMDYGKFRYEESQKAKEARKKSIHVTVKEVKFRPKIGKGDFDTKVRHMHGVPRRGSQGQGHAAVPGPRDGPPRARFSDPRRRDQRRRPGGQGRERRLGSKGGTCRWCWLLTRRPKTRRRRRPRSRRRVGSAAVGGARFDSTAEATATPTETTESETTASTQPNTTQIDTDRPTSRHHRREATEMATVAVTASDDDAGSGEPHAEDEDEQDRGEAVQEDRHRQAPSSAGDAPAPVREEVVDPHPSSRRRRRRPPGRRQRRSSACSPSADRTQSPAQAKS